MPQMHPRTMRAAKNRYRQARNEAKQHGANTHRHYTKRDAGGRLFATRSIFTRGEERSFAASNLNRTHGQAHRGLRAHANARGLVKHAASVESHANRLAVSHKRSDRLHADKMRRSAKGYRAEAKRLSNGQVKAHTRKLKSGKTVTVRAYAAGKRGAGRKGGRGRRR